MPGNARLGLFTLPRWERTYLGVFPDPPLPSRTGWGDPARLLPRDPLTPLKPLSLGPPGRCLCPLHSWAGRAKAPTCARGWVRGGPGWVLPRGTPPEGLWGGGCSLLSPLLHLAASPSFQRSRHGSGSRHRETQKEEKQEVGGEKVFKSTKKQKKKKSPPP